MEEPTQQNNRRERIENGVEDLHLDRVVASQPEIGPTPPDGGYGWMIVISAIIYNVTVPTVIILYGLVILKSIREEDHAEGEKMKIWDQDLALIPVIMIVIRLLLESWCRAVVKIFNMPRFTALAGLCLTIAGILLSSYSTNVYENDHIVNIFAGIFAGAGSALTGQQTDVLITHYFRDKLTTTQRLVRMAPSLGNVLSCLLVGYLCTVYTADVVVMIYGALLMQNCFFLAAYTRPVYIERVIRSTYNMIRAVEDEDDVIFSNQTADRSQRPTGSRDMRVEVSSENPVSVQDEDANDVVVFKSNRNAREIIDPEVEQRENSRDMRFSTDFSTMFETPNRFSSDFGNLDVMSYSRINGYQELENIDREQHPQPLYRETTVNAPSNSLVFTSDVTPGTARRTASLKKNFITVVNMLLDFNFYLYTVLHLCTTFSILILGLLFPSMLWELNPSMNIWSVSVSSAVAYSGAFCFIILIIALPQNINEKARLCTVFCLIGAVGFYGITLSSSKSFMVVWCTLASLATAASSVLQQPLYNSLNDFDTIATMTTANAIVAIFIMIWSLVYNYEYRTCFFIASLLQTGTGCLFFAASFRRRR
ncbi:unnamed protein product [Danaus chrysippus]|uniref:(African queen) hypothetical protein n=1 Tax=Danaus chrysippus TaxID=151541 RepID=A0A8J2QGH3_9NEOP|nr:unnamed protein product [Danaus chrysippus]